MVLFENLEKKKFQNSPKNQIDAKMAKTIQVPYILSYFFIKMVFFDVDLFSPCFDME